MTSHLIKTRKSRKKFRNNFRKFRVIFHAKEKQQKHLHSPLGKYFEKISARNFKQLVFEYKAIIFA